MELPNYKLEQSPVLQGQEWRGGRADCWPLIARVLFLANFPHAPGNCRSTASFFSEIIARRRLVALARTVPEEHNVLTPRKPRPRRRHVETLINKKEKKKTYRGNETALARAMPRETILAQLTQTETIIYRNKIQNSRGGET